MARYGVQAVRAGFKRLGLDNAFEAALRKLDKPGTPGTNPCRLNSFSAETVVMTDEGLRAISTLAWGDMVLAYHELTGEIDFYPILATIVHQDQVIQLLTIDGETIVTTPNHPFYTGVDEWVPAGELQVGDTIRNGQWDTGLVEAITFVYDPQPMYNLTVAAAHTYFVGDGQWLVHNNNCTNVHWPSKPHGVPAHWNVIQREVDKMVNSQQYTDIYVNKAISTATGGKVQSGLRPDVMAETNSGRYIVIEVVSPSQTRQQLENKMRQIQQLLGPLFESGNVIDP